MTAQSNIHREYVKLRLSFERVSATPSIGDSTNSERENRNDYMSEGVVDPLNDRSSESP